MITKNKACILLLISILLFSACMVPCNAISSELVTEDLEEERIAGLFSNFKVAPLSEPTVHAGFCCFNINDNGDYALGFGSPGKDRIQVYDANGNYLYGYTFNCQGSFCITLEADAFVIYDLRSGLAIYINKSGECLDMKYVPEISENISYRHQTINARKKVGNDGIYMAEHPLSDSESLSFGTYPQLTRTDADGNTTILFKASNHPLWIIFLALFIFSLVSGIIVISIIKNRGRGSCHMPM